jgi:hypothetical protein
VALAINPVGGLLHKAISGQTTASRNLYYVHHSDGCFVWKGERMVTKYYGAKKIVHVVACPRCNGIGTVWSPRLKGWHTCCDCLGTGDTSRANSEAAATFRAHFDSEGEE